MVARFAHRVRRQQGDHKVAPTFSRCSDPLEVPTGIDFDGGRAVVNDLNPYEHFVQALFFDELGRAGSKAELFESSDVLSLHVRLTAETRGIVGPDDLARMKPTALIVNTSRAELMAPGALLAALRAGRPGYAAVDVYEQEPITNGDHPFLAMPNVLCTPHLGWAEWDNFELYFAECFEQIQAYGQGAALRLANPDVKVRPCTA